MVRSVMSNWLAMVINGIISFLLVPVILHGLGTFQYGLWVFVGSVLDYYGLLDLGVRPTMHRFVGLLRGTNQRKALNETVCTALAVTLVVDCAIIVISGVFAYVLPGFLRLTPADTILFQRVMVVLGLAVAVQFPTRVLGAYLCGLQRFDLYNLATVTIAAVRAIAIVIVLNAGHRLLGIAAVTLGTSVLWLLITSLFVRSADPGLSLPWRRVAWGRARQLGAYSAWAFLATIGDYLRFYTDAVVIGRLLTVAAVTPFSIAARLMEYFKMTIVGIAGPLMPRMSELEGQDRQHELRELFLRSTTWTAVLSIMVCSLLLLDGRSLLRIWLGPEFSRSYILLMILAAGYVADLAQYPSAVAIYAKARHKYLGMWTVAEGAANLALSIYWAPKYGLAGVALGTMIPMLVTKILIQPWYTLRLMRISGREYFWGALFRPLVVGGLFVPLSYIHVGSAGDGILGLLVAVLEHMALFALLALVLCLNAAERQLLVRRGRQFAAVLRLWRV